MALVLLLTAATAKASPGDLDPGFGQFGRVQVDGSAFDVGTDGAGSTYVEFTAYDGRGYPRVLKLSPSGRPDPSFGDHGVAEVPLGDDSRMVVAADGRTTFAGRAGDRTDSGLKLVRLDAAGSPDPTFGAGGTAQISLAAQNSLLFDLALDPAGRTLVFGSDGGGSKLAAVRSDGTLDPAFGSGGIASVAGIAGPGRIAVSPGAVTVAGGASAPDYGAGRLARLQLSDGLPDPGFAPSALERPLDAGRVTGLAADGGGAFGLAATQLGHGLYDYPEAFALRYGASGTRDAGFADGGLTAPGDRSVAPIDVAIDAAGGMLVAGTSYSPLGHAYTADSEATVFRLTADGSRDPGWGEGGGASLPDPSGYTAMTLAADGKVAAAGGSTVSRLLTVAGPDDMDADGVLDPDDACPRAPQPGGGGCPVLRPRVRMELGRAKFIGTVRGPQACRFAQGFDAYGEPHPARVFVFRSRTGVDRPVGFARVTSNGTWRLKQRPRRGSYYYARYRHYRDPDAGVCKPAESRTLHLKR